MLLYHFPHVAVHIAYCVHSKQSACVFNPAKMNPSPASKNSNNKRKKKRTVLVNARKYAKQGTFGRGTHMEEETYRYFVSVLELLNDGFEDDETKQSLINNVFEQTRNKEVDFSCNQIGCRAIESVLPFASAEDLERFISVLSQDLRPLCSDRYASHVLQKMIDTTSNRATDELQTSPNAEPIKKKEKQEIQEKQFPKNHLEVCGAFTLKISKYLLNNLEDFVWDTFGNHIIRTCVLNLSGIDTFNEDTKSKKFDSNINRKYRNVPEEWKEVAVEYAKRLSAWPQFRDLSYSEVTSGLLQSILQSLKQCDEHFLNKIIKKIVKETFAPKDTPSADGPTTNVDEPKIPPVFDSEPAVRLLEVALLYCNTKMHHYIYKKCFQNNLRALTLTRKSNFAVQKLISCCSDKDEFVEILKELSESFADIMSSGHTGVLVSIAKTSRKLTAEQGQFVKLISAALHCEDSNSSFKLVPLTARMLPLQRAEKAESFFVNLHGSLIVQEMLNFNKPIKIVNSLLAMSTEELLTLFCDAKGSRIGDAFFMSRYIGEKSREKMCRKLKGCFMQLAMSKPGSRLFDCIWDHTDRGQHVRIMTELSTKTAQLNGSESGRLISNKYNVELFKRNADDWENHTQKSHKIKDMFEDILGDDIEMK